jgi:hypothetical protein
LPANHPNFGRPSGQPENSRLRDIAQNHRTKSEKGASPMSLSFADFAWILLALTAAIAAGAYFFSKNRVEPVGVVRSNDFTDERLRQAAIQAVKGVDVSKMGAEEAEAHLEELARHAVAREYSEIYPGLKVEVTPSWPDAKCVISGNIASIRLWTGHRIVGDREGIRSINVEVNRQATLKLETRRPLKDAWGDLTSPPAKSEPVAPRLKVAPPPSTTPPPRAAPRKATLKR